MAPNPDIADPQSSRYVAGIDLGTTNSAVTYVDTAGEPWRVRTFAVPQLVAPGQIESLETLPSFHYEPAAGEFAGGALRLPWSKDEPGCAVGVFAREQGMLVPGRAIQSAKSWLCHTGVDRTAELLPWHGAADVERLSPVEVSARYLRHIAAAWDHRFREHPLSEQDIVLTLPASFDEIARELTVEAARRAGLPRVVLIEEPQAAFYAWIDAHRDRWQTLVEPGQKILVCDIGGGTTDFTLIRVRAGEGGKVRFHRVAVGEHLILGGDNLDLALARHVERKLATSDPDAPSVRVTEPSREPETSKPLEPRQWAILVRICRHVKETLLAANPPERYTIHLPGTGARLLGGGVQVEVTRDEVEQVLIEGFLPRVTFDEKPQARRSGFQEFGLPFAADAAITRYLAAFLTTHRHVALDDEFRVAAHDPARPDIVLFNGGFFESPVLRQRLLDVLSSWFREKHPTWQPVVLANERLDLAVARGAAYYGMVRRGHGERIAAGLARTYYIGVEGDGRGGRGDEADPAGAAAPAQALCLLPAGIEPGQDVDLTERSFNLLVAQPIEFPLFVSSTRLTDRPGELVPVDREQMRALPPIRTVLKTSRTKDSGVVPVYLHAGLTEIGTLDLSCREVEGRRTWRLQFDVRSATQTDVAAHAATGEQFGFLEEEAWQSVSGLIAATFGLKGGDNPAGLAKRMAAALDLSRQDWPPSLLRRVWEALIEFEAGRRRSQEHEARWLNLLGFALRPGYGVALDDWRVAETWRVLQGKLVHPTPSCRAEWWILWRRIGGGLTAGQQQALAAPLLASIRQSHRQSQTGRGKGGAGMTTGGHEAAEIWRLLGSFELLPVSTRTELGDMIVDLVPRPKMEAVRPALLWALGRVGARRHVYGPLNTVVPSARAAAWIGKLIDLCVSEPAANLAVMQLARRTDDRFRDVPDDVRQAAAAWLSERGAPEHYIELVREGGTLDAAEQGLVFGESLPKGLRIV